MSLIKLLRARFNLMKMNKRTVFILGISSDIGIALAKYYARDGFNIIGTYRSAKLLPELKDIRNCHLFFCDISDKGSIRQFIGRYKKLDLPWDMFISCVGSQQPIGKFFDCDFEEWSKSIHVNAIEQLKMLHMMHKFRTRKGAATVVFFAGGGTNNPVPLYSAYTASKIMLIKMCELLDNENKDMNIFIIGPGWVKTKIHYETLWRGKTIGENYFKTKDFMKSGTGTSMEDIYSHINWLAEKGKNISSGRNFSVVYDHWRNGGTALARQLRADPDKFKLRRFKNK